MPRSNRRNESIQGEIERLRRTIEDYNYAYFVRVDPVVPDTEYDRLLNRLKEVEQAHPYS